MPVIETHLVRSAEPPGVLERQRTAALTPGDQCDLRCHRQGDPHPAIDTALLRSYPDHEGSPHAESLEIRPGHLPFWLPARFRSRRPVAALKPVAAFSLKKKSAMARAFGGVTHRSARVIQSPRCLNCHP